MNGGPSIAAENVTFADMVDFGTEFAVASGRHVRPFQAQSNQHGSRQMNIRKSLGLALMAAAGLCVGTTAQPAHATDSGVCTVTYVKWYLNDGGTLALNCGGTWYAADIANGAAECNTTMDNLKAWLSIAQAAQLSGKKLNISYNATTHNCDINGSRRAIFAMQLEP